MNIMPLAFVPFLFSGFLVSIDQIPGFLRWIQYGQRGATLPPTGT